MIDWKQHEERLRELVQDIEVTDQTIADELGMELGEHLTAEQVRSARRRLGIEKPGPGKTRGVVVFPPSQVHLVIEDYVSLGGDLTAREVARKHGLSVKEVKAILKEEGITKSSLPFTSTDIENVPENDLVGLVLARKEQNIARKIEAEYVTRLEADYRRLLKERMSQDRMFEAARDLAERMDGTEALNIDLEFVHPREKGDLWQAHIPTADEHVGSLVWEPEAFGEDYDTKIACARLRQHAKLAAEWIQSQPGECTMIHRSFLGDLFHALLGGTEKGTRLDQDTRAGKVWYLLMEALRDSVTILAETGVPVTVRGVKGNHDGAFEFLAAMYTLKMIFEANDNVEVITTPGRYEAFLVNKTAHVLDHGDGYQSVAAERTRRGADMVARQLGIAGADQIITYVGHNHSYEAEFGQHTVIRLPAFGESDEYETSIRYFHEPQAQLFRLNREGKIDTVKRLYRSDLEG